MMKKIQFISLILLISLFSCTSIDVAYTNTQIIQKRMKRVAVLPFEITGADRGNEFADAISHQFFKNGKVETIEREAIEKILQEQPFQASGLIDEKDVIIIGRSTALQAYRKNKYEPNCIDTFTLKAINTENGEILLTVRKEPCIAWDWRYRAQYCCGLTLIWDTNDILVESSQYDDIAKQLVKKILLIMENDKNK
jgi:hypothetical protein